MIESLHLYASRTKTVDLLPSDIPTDPTQLQYIINNKGLRSNNGVVTTSLTCRNNACKRSNLQAQERYNNFGALQIIRLQNHNLSRRIIPNHVLQIGGNYYELQSRIDATSRSGTHFTASYRHLDSVYYSDSINRHTRCEGKYPEQITNIRPLTWMFFYIKTGEVPPNEQNPSSMDLS